MQSARAIFTLAGLYGLIALIPGLITETQFSAANPPALTHPIFYYGFYGSALVWQLVFLMIGRDPARWRMLMPIATLEKAAFFLPALWLYQQGRLVMGEIFAGAMIDGLLLLLFIYAWHATRPRAPE